MPPSKWLRRVTRRLRLIADGDIGNYVFSPRESQLLLKYPPLDNCNVVGVFSLALNSLAPPQHEDLRRQLRQPFYPRGVDAMQIAVRWGAELRVPGASLVGLRVACAWLISATNSSVGISSGSIARSGKQISERWPRNL